MSNYSHLGTSQDFDFDALIASKPSTADLLALHKERSIAGDDYVVMDLEDEFTDIDFPYTPNPARVAKLAKAIDPNTPAAELEALSHDIDLEEAIANNPSTPARVRARLVGNIRRDAGIG